MKPTLGALDVLTIINKNMIKYKKSWSNISRGFIVDKMGEWLGHRIGKSYLSDIKGKLVREGYLKFWQTPRYNSDNTYAGSESRCQFTMKAIRMMTAHGIRVSKCAWETAKKYWRQGKKKMLNAYETAWEEARKAYNPNNERPSDWQIQGPKIGAQTPDPKKNPFTNPNARRRPGIKGPIPDPA